MGNCIVVQEKVIKVMKIDGKILEYKAPIKVHQILSQFSCHVISNSLQAIDNQHLHLDDDLLGGQIYYLLPSLQVQPPPKSTLKKVKFANDQVKKKVKFANDQVNEKVIKFANDQLNEMVKFANDQVIKKVKFANDQVNEKVMFANDDQLNEKVKFARDQVEILEANNQKKEVIRVKIVITKKELQELLSSEVGLIKVDDINSTTTTIVDETTINSKGWKPVLDIIPELDENTQPVRTRLCVV